jgi:C4-dicarboxylate-specific signal transduction histidine kinase/CheY-like chemotaxis protein
MASPSPPFQAGGDTTPALLRRDLPWLGALLALALLGNHFRVIVVHGSDVLFGTAFSTAAVLLFGPLRGGAVAALSLLPTVSGYGHPYALVAYTLEALAVGAAWRCRRTEPALASALYWALVGMPLVYLAFRHALGSGPLVSSFIACKQGLNGLVNVVLARSLLTFWRYSRLPLPPSAGAGEGVRLREVLLSSFALFVLVPSVTLVAASARSESGETARLVSREIDSLSVQAEELLSMRVERNRTILEGVARSVNLASLRPGDAGILEMARRSSSLFREIALVAVDGRIVLESPAPGGGAPAGGGGGTAGERFLREMSASLSPVFVASSGITGEKGVNRLFAAVPVLDRGVLRGWVCGALNEGQYEDLLRRTVEAWGAAATLLDDRGRVIVSTREGVRPHAPFSLRSLGEATSVAGDTYFFRPAASPGVPRVERVRRSVYFREVHLSEPPGWLLLLEMPDEPFQAAAFTRYRAGFLLIFAVLAAALAAGTALSARSARRIEELEALTEGLPGRVEAGEEVRWPESGVEEMASLVRNVGGMARALSARFAEIRSANERLEERVRERTEELRRANEDLFAEMDGRRKGEEERRRLEAQVLHAQKLESLGVLAGGIAHDFNNLLTGILGNAELAGHDLPEGSAGGERLAQIRIAAGRASEMTRQMLAYSGKGKFVLAPVNVLAMIRETAKLLDLSISKRCTLEFRFPDASPAVEGDESQLRQVVMNLVMNASEAIGDREGTIRIAVREDRFDARGVERFRIGDPLGEGRYVEIAVEDDGCGMDAETVSRIFDPFFTTKFTGRGLGLAAVQGIVRAHHGGMAVESSPGSGTAFRILLPALAGPAPAGQAEAPPRPDDGSWRSYGAVLVADDEDGVRDLAREILERTGFAVVEARDGREAVERFREWPEGFRAVLLDMTMPVMGGDEAMGGIRELRPAVPVILMSGFSRQALEGRLEGEGGFVFLQKPFRVAELKGAVRGALGE